MRLPLSIYINCYFRYFTIFPRDTMDKLIRSSAFNPHICSPYYSTSHHFLYYFHINNFHYLNKTYFYLLKIYLYFI